MRVDLETKFTAIWEEFGRPLRNFIEKRVHNSQDAEDVLQEALVRIARGLADLKDDAKLHAWEYRITRSAIVDHYRKNSARVELTELTEDLANEPDDSLSPNEEIIACLRAMIDHLPEKYRRAIILTEFQNLTQKELSHEMGLTLSGAKSRVQRARVMLKETLLSCCHLEFDRLGNIIDHTHRTKDCEFC